MVNSATTTSSVTQHEVNMDRSIDLFDHGFDDDLPDPADLLRQSNTANRQSTIVRQSGGPQIHTPGQINNGNINHGYNGYEGGPRNQSNRSSEHENNDEDDEDDEDEGEIIQGDHNDNDNDDNDENNDNNDDDDCDNDDDHDNGRRDHMRGPSPSHNDPLLGESTFCPSDWSTDT